MNKDEALTMAIVTLEAFEITGYCDETIQACKEALEQPAYETESWKNNMKEAEEILAKAKFANEQPAQEPVAIVMPIYDDDHEYNDIIDCYLPPNTKLYTHPAPAIVQEPVGQVRVRNGEWFGYIFASQLKNVEAGDNLHTSPPAIKFLNDCEINDFWDEYGGNWRAFARAIEQALRNKNGY